MKLDVTNKLKSFLIPLAAFAGVLVSGSSPSLAQGAGPYTLPSTPTAPAPSPAGAQVSGAALIAANCAVCHGPQGAGAGDIVKLNDKTPTQIVEAMGAFRTGKKPSTIMGRISKGYSDAQIAAVAGQLGKK